jgi:nicotinamide-nucleotide amidase
MTENNRRQAYVPAGASIIDNPVGTAPAFIVEIGEKAFISLPGVPHEMEYLLGARVLPYLSHKLGHGAVILCRMVHTAGMGESVIDQAITDLMHNINPTVGTRAHPAQTDVCITAKAATHEEALQLLAPVEAMVRQRLGVAVYGVDDETLPGVIVAALLQRRLTLTIGETHTGGLLARCLLEIEGGARTLRSSRIALDLAMLAREVDMPVTQNAADTVHAIATALRSSTGADLALVVAQDNAQTPQLYIALATPNGVQTYQSSSRGRSDYAIAWTYHTALDAVRQWLLASSPASL